MSVLTLENVSKRYGSFAALKGIDMRLEKGEVYGFIGPNGAGKTTTIRILLGILKPSGGKASIFGMDAWRDAVEIHKSIAYVPGDVNLWGNLTGGEVIDLFTRLQGKGTSKRHEELCQRFSLDPRKKCRTYSKGNRQKVALVAAFASEAELYIMDEPTSGLDPLMEKVFQECVAEAKAAGKTILLSSHILQEVERLCDRVSIIREGRIIESGTLKELRHLTQVRMTVSTERPLTGLEGMEGVWGLRQKGEEWRFSVENDALGRVMQHVAGFGVRSIESAPPSLEELFMSHYAAEGSSQTNHHG